MTPGNAETETRAVPAAYGDSSPQQGACLHALREALHVERARHQRERNALLLRAHSAEMALRAMQRRAVEPEDADTARTKGTPLWRACSAWVSQHAHAPDAHTSALLTENLYLSLRQVDWTPDGWLRGLIAELSGLVDYLTLPCGTAASPAVAHWARQWVQSAPVDMNADVMHRHPISGPWLDMRRITAGEAPKKDPENG